MENGGTRQTGHCDDRDVVRSALGTDRRHEDTYSLDPKKAEAGQNIAFLLLFDFLKSVLGK
jgi:hypothetical protein